MAVEQDGSTSFGSPKRHISTSTPLSTTITSSGVASHHRRSEKQLKGPKLWYQVRMVMRRSSNVTINVKQYPEVIRLFYDSKSATFTQDQLHMA